MSFNQKGQTKKLLKLLKRIENPCCDCPEISKDEGNVIECRHDGLFAPEGGAGYTDEQAQDAVGGILNSDEFIYDDVTPLISINEIDWSKIINAPTFAAGAENGVSLNGDIVVLGNDPGDPLAPGSIQSQREVLFSGGGIRWGAPSPGGVGGQGSFEIGLLYGPPGGSQSFYVEGTTAAGADHSFMSFTKEGFLINDEVGGARNNFTVDTNSLGSRITSDLPITLADMFKTENSPNISALLGDFSNIGNGTHLSIDDGTRQVLLLTDQTRYLFASPQVYGFGELLGFNNGSQIGIDDVNQSFDYQTITAGHLLNISGGAGNASLGDLDFNTTGFQMFLDYANQHFSIITGVFPGSRLFDIDRVASLYQIGDIDNVANNTMFFIDDANTVISASIGGYTDPGMYIQINAGLYLFGDSSGNHNGNALFIDDSAGVMRLQTNGFYWVHTNDTTDTLSLSSPGDASININGATGLIEIGDLASSGNGIQLDIADATGLFSFSNTANNAALRVNGVTGFTGTVTPVTSITVVGGIVTAVS